MPRNQALVIILEEDTVNELRKLHDEITSYFSANPDATVSVSFGKPNKAPKTSDALKEVMLAALVVATRTKRLM